jgi:rubrerythrin
MEVYRCRFCGETHLGLGSITNCPFCGAHKKYMVPISEWKDENVGVEYGELTKKNLETALDVEIGNTSFYLVASKAAETTEAQGIFKRLSKVELEHAEVFAKLLKVDLPPHQALESKGSDEANFEESFKRESIAINHYDKSAAETVEPRVREIFKILIGVEKDHLRLDKNRLGK